MYRFARRSVVDPDRRIQQRERRWCGINHQPQQQSNETEGPVRKQLEAHNQWQPGRFKSKAQISVEIKVRHSPRHAFASTLVLPKSSKRQDNERDFNCTVVPKANRISFLTKPFSPAIIIRGAHEISSPPAGFDDLERKRYWGSA